MTVLGLLTTTYGAPSAREDLESLLLGVAAGDSHSLEELYHRTRTAVYGLVLSYLKHPQDAEDVTQDAFVRIWDTAASYRPQGKPMAWLLTVARNLALMRLRERGKTQELTDEEWSALPARAPGCHHGGPPRPPRRPFRPVRAGAAGGHAPCGHRPEAPGDRPAAGAPPCHSPVQIPPGPEETEPASGRR